MTRFLVIAALSLLIVPTAYAADDGGFGTGGFSGKAPNALSEDGAGTGYAAAPDFNPNDIEPASGEEEAVPAEGAAGGQPAQAAPETEDPDAAERPPAE